MVRPHYTGNDPGHDLFHAVRVAELAEMLASEEGVESGILSPAALCHDICRWESRSHGSDNGAFISELLNGVGFQAPEIERITRAIRRHSFDSPEPPATVEEKILFDADKLDGLGAIGIGRCFAVSGALRQSIFSVTPGDVTAQRMLLDLMGRYYQRLHTATARRIGKERNDFLALFIERLEAELSVVSDAEFPEPAG